MFVICDEDWDWPTDSPIPLAAIAQKFHMPDTKATLIKKPAKQQQRVTPPPAWMPQKQYRERLAATLGCT